MGCIVSCFVDVLSYGVLLCCVMMLWHDGLCCVVFFHIKLCCDMLCCVVWCCVAL